MTAKVNRKFNNLTVSLIWEAMTAAMSLVKKTTSPKTKAV